MVIVKTLDGQWRHHYEVQKIYLDLAAKEWYLYYLIRSRITLNVCWITLNNINTDNLFLIRSIWRRTNGHHFLTKKIRIITRWKQSLNPGSLVSILATVLCSFTGVWFRGQKRGSSLGHHVKRADILAVCLSQFVMPPQNSSWTIHGKQECIFSRLWRLGSVRTACVGDLGGLPLGALWLYPPVWIIVLCSFKAEVGKARKPNLREASLPGSSSRSQNWSPRD